MFRIPQKRNKLLFCPCMLSHFSCGQLFVTLWTWPIRLLCSCNSPGKNTGVGCHVLLQGIFLTQGSNPDLLHLLHWQAGSLPLNHLGSPSDWVCSVTHSCPTLCDPMDWSPPGSSVHGIFQARILQWVAIPFSRGYSWPRNRILISCIAGWFFTIWAIWEAWWWKLYPDSKERWWLKQSV